MSTTGSGTVHNVGGNPGAAADAIELRDGNVGTLIFPGTEGTYRINRDLELTSHVKIEKGAILRPNTGVTITISGSFEAGLYQCFDVSRGYVVFSDGSLEKGVLPEWYGAKGDGVTNDRASFEAAGSAPIYLASGRDYLIGTDLAIPSRIVSNGGKIQPASGVTITINGPFAAGLYQVFDVSSGGTIRFDEASAEVLYPEWWGAKADNATDSGPALQAWDDCRRDSGGPRGVLQAGTYLTSQAISFRSHGIIEAAGNKRTFIKATAAMEAVGRINKDYQRFRGIRFNANRKANYGLLMLYSVQSKFEACETQNAIYDGVHFENDNYAGWLADDLISNPSQVINNDHVEWHDHTSILNGTTYKSSTAIYLRNSSNVVTQGGTIRWDSTAQRLIATAPAAFSGLSPSEPRPEDLVRLKVTLDSAGAAGTVTVPGTATLINGDKRVRITSGALLTYNVRAGDRFICNGFEKEIKEVVDNEYLIFAVAPSAVHAGSGLAYEIRTETIFAIDTIVGATEVTTQYPVTKPTYDIPDSEYAITVGDGAFEKRHGDNNENQWFNGLFRLNAGCGRVLQGLYGPAISGGNTDFNNGFSLRLGTFSIANPTITALVHKHYSESHSAGHILLGAVRDCIIGPSVNGDGAQFGGIRGDIEVIDRTNVGFYRQTNYNENTGYGLHVSPFQGGIRFGNPARNLAMASDGIPHLTDRGSRWRAMLSRRAAPTTTPAAGATADVLCTVSLPATALKSYERDELKPRITVVGDSGPAALVGAWGFTYNSGSARFEITVRVQNDHTVSQTITIHFEVE